MTIRIRVVKSSGSGISAAIVAIAAARRACGTRDTSWRPPCEPIHSYRWATSRKSLLTSTSRADAEVNPAAEEAWTDKMNDSSGMSSFLTSSYFYGGNIPGKPVKQLLNPTGRSTLQEMIAEDAKADYSSLTFSRATPPAE